ncbi:uncharacterized protein LODBEIA_P05390 [Lodderomyces beijingensis]|uniref:Altered inheritance of mitochondria protein 21 n=1 Tax=Lodderomyces beijingensis TaxID=1775926 RepID=A0ABP0ZJ03_9ASCO
MGSSNNTPSIPRRPTKKSARNSPVIPHNHGSNSNSTVGSSKKEKLVDGSTKIEDLRLEERVPGAANVTSERDSRGEIDFTEAPVATSTETETENEADDIELKSIGRESYSGGDGDGDGEKTPGNSTTKATFKYDVEDSVPQDDNSCFDDDMETIQEKQDREHIVSSSDANHAPSQESPTEAASSRNEQAVPSEKTSEYDLLELYSAEDESAELDPHEKAASDSALDETKVEEKLPEREAESPLSAKKPFIPSRPSKKIASISTGSETPEVAKSTSDSPATGDASDGKVACKSGAIDNATQNAQDKDQNLSTSDTGTTSKPVTGSQKTSVVTQAEPTVPKRPMMKNLGSSEQKKRPIGGSDVEGSSLSSKKNANPEQVPSSDAGDAASETADVAESLPDKPIIPGRPLRNASKPEDEKEEKEKEEKKKNNACVEGDRNEIPHEQNPPIPDKSGEVSGQEISDAAKGSRFSDSNHATGESTPKGPTIPNRPSRQKLPPRDRKEFDYNNKAPEDQDSLSEEKKAVESPKLESSSNKSETDLDHGSTEEIVSSTPIKPVVPGRPIKRTTGLKDATTATDDEKHQVQATSTADPQDKSGDSTSAAPKEVSDIASNKPSTPERPGSFEAKAKSKPPPPKPKKMSSKIAAFQQQLFNTTGGGGGASNLQDGDNSGPPSHSLKFPFAIGGRPLPGMVIRPQPQLQPSTSTSTSTLTEEDRENDVVPDTGLPKVAKRTRGPKGKKLPKAVKNSNVELEASRVAERGKLWSLSFSNPSAPDTNDEKMEKVAEKSQDEPLVATTGADLPHDKSEQDQSSLLKEYEASEPALEEETTAANSATVGAASTIEEETGDIPVGKVEREEKEKEKEDQGTSKNVLEELADSFQHPAEKVPAKDDDDDLKVDRSDFNEPESVESGESIFAKSDGAGANAYLVDSNPSEGDVQQESESEPH